ncbi:zinc ribbon domain-containing protein [Schaalia sp. 19OD2882]|uniref:zinc ribbon domain-containing protein n=1 Tax=Schaalia sp. 19OD2882 TaxID=2794089 RepID=UPI001C1EDE3A|nr:zinc ribbon domain-containing protein [Schaalia sp. 19OD2882]
MPLISCPECGTRISDTARTCLYCGACDSEGRALLHISTGEGSKVDWDSGELAQALGGSLPFWATAA